MPGPPQAVEVSCNGDAKTKLNIQQNNITKEVEYRVITSG